MAICIVTSFFGKQRRGTYDIGKAVREKWLDLGALHHPERRHRSWLQPGQGRLVQKTRIQEQLVDVWCMKTIELGRLSKHLFLARPTDPCICSFFPTTNKPLEKGQCEVHSLLVGGGVAMILRGRDNAANTVTPIRAGTPLSHACIQLGGEEPIILREGNLLCAPAWPP